MSAITKSTVPFTKVVELHEDDQEFDSEQTFPGWPGVLRSDVKDIRSILRQELWAEDLERKAHRLWVLTTPSSSNIHSLHEQKVRSRQIVVTEDPKLHLVWERHRIFVKPLPSFLCSWQCWQTYLSAESGVDIEVRQAALGFLRSWCRLIRHESDFRIARREDLELIPKGVKWEELMRFLKQVENITDADVSGRWMYGELRLSRLNFYAPLLFGRWYYVHMPTQFGEYFARLYGPVLVIFTIASIMLNSMQVTLAAGDTGVDIESVGRVFFWFSIVVLIVVASVVVASGALWAYILLDEYFFTVSRYRQRRALEKQLD